jgi:hypothetical protein
MEKMLLLVPPAAFVTGAKLEAKLGAVFGNSF